jgi:potassium-dependent mechanosensitive channel
VKVSVAYTADPEEVREVLMACACAHPQVLQVPAPNVFLVLFGPSALDFELRCVVSNVDYGLTVKSDLHFAILRRFRAAGIEIPYPRQDVRLLPGGAMPQAAGKEDAGLRDP